MNKEVNKVVVLAGGYGTRMYPFTKVVPKELLPIGNVPCIQYVINECYYAGIEEVIVLINESKKILIDYFDKRSQKTTIFDEINSSMNIKFVMQSRSRGTASAIYDCKDYVKDEVFGVIFPDELFLGNISAIGQLKASYQNSNFQTIGIKKVERKNCHKYGVVELTNDFFLRKIIEKPSNNDIPSEYISCGRMVLSSEIFGLYDQIKPVNGEYYLPHLLNKSVSKNIKCEVINGSRCDTGNINDYLKTLIDFANDIPELNDYIKSKI